MNLRERCDKFWSDLTELKESRLNPYNEMGTLLENFAREIRNELLEEVMLALKSDEASHTILNGKCEFEWRKENHIGPSLMAGTLWADWLKFKVDALAASGSEDK